jgi:hypothetical protein
MPSRRLTYVPLSPPPKSLGGLQDGIGAGSAAGAGAAGFGAERRLGAALRADFFLVERFAAFAAFAVLRFLRAGAAFLLVDRFFAFFLFAMIDLPILCPYKIDAVATPKPAPETRYGTSHPTVGPTPLSRSPLQVPSPGS